MHSKALRQGCAACQQPDQLEQARPQSRASSALDAMLCAPSCAARPSVRRSERGACASRRSRLLAERLRPRPGPCAQGCTLRLAWWASTWPSPTASRWPWWPPTSPPPRCPASARSPAPAGPSPTLCSVRPARPALLPQALWGRQAGLQRLPSHQKRTLRTLGCPSLRGCPCGQACCAGAALSAPPGCCRHHPGLQQQRGGEGCLTCPWHRDAGNIGCFLGGTVATLLSGLALVLFTRFGDLGREEAITAGGKAKEVARRS